MDTVPRRSTRAAAVFAGLGLVGILAACSPADASGGPAAGTSDDESGSATEDSGTPSSGDVSYADGTYEADGSYRSPGGNESVAVSITLEGDTVAAVEVTPEATSGNAAQFQKAFADGIAGEVVGKDIDSLQVSKVSGSSLTSGGFNEALEKIKADAAL